MNERGWATFYLCLAVVWTITWFAYCFWVGWL